MLRLKESSEAWMESLTLVKTAAPSAIPKSTVKARPGCFRKLRKLNQTKNLKKIYTTEEVETTALNNVNLEISPAEFVAIMGPSGCGKSTLLNLLGLLDNPTEGE